MKKFIFNHFKSEALLKHYHDQSINNYSQQSVNSKLEILSVMYVPILYIDLTLNRAPKYLYRLLNKNEIS